LGELKAVESVAAHWVDQQSDYGGIRQVDAGTQIADGVMTIPLVLDPFPLLRRELACRLLGSSADPHDVRDFLGHANITTTSRYFGSTPVRLAQALERMEASVVTVADAEDQPTSLRCAGGSHVRDDRRSIAVRSGSLPVRNRIEFLTDIAVM